MSGCGKCCGSCGGCGEMILAPGEVKMLRALGQIPFLPVARRADDMTPMYFEDESCAPEESSLILQCLEAKGLIRIDYDAPLKGADMGAYTGYPVHGSMALTEKGQQVLDILEKQGLQ